MLILNFDDAKIITFSELYQMFGIIFYNLYAVEIDSDIILKPKRRYKE